MSTLKKNTELTESFDHLVDLSKGHLQTLTDLNGQTYLSFFTDKLFYSFGYSNPEINRDINGFIKAHQTKPVDLKALNSEIREQLMKYLPRRLHHLYFDGSDIYSPILKSLSINGHFRILCLEKPEQISEPYRDQLYTFKELLGKDLQASEDKIIPDITDLRHLIKQYRSEIAACIINPILFKQGHLLQEKELFPLLEQLKKAKIPLIWDDSHAGFYRLGPTFTFDLYHAEPDILIYDQKLNGDRRLQFAAVSKKISRFVPEEDLSISSATLPNLIIFRGILNSLSQHQYAASTRDLGTRIQGKLRALEANSGRLFTKSGNGLTWFINLQDPEHKTALIRQMKEKGYLIKALDSQSTAIFIYPPLCISEHDIDMMIEALKQFLEQLKQDSDA